MEKLHPNNHRRPMIDQDAGRKVRSGQRLHLAHPSFLLFAHPVAPSVTVEGAVRSESAKDIFALSDLIMRKFVIPPLLAVLFIASCASGVGVGDRTVVKGPSPELLKLRAGPGLGFNVILGLPDGTVVTRRDCVTEMGQRWYRVSLGTTPGTTGYVSADYRSR